MASESIPSLVAALRATFAEGRTRPLEYRQRQLAGLGRFLEERERQIEEALHLDLGKPSLEAFSAEIAFTGRQLAIVR